MTETLASTSVLQQFVERARTLYSLPRVALQVLELTAQPQVDAQDLKACLEHDPALVAKILRVVNSSLFGLSRPLSDLQQAIALLGIKPLKLLVLGFSLPRELWSGLEAETLARYWRRTLVKAVSAREFAEQVWHAPGDEPFIAGLLQDVGMLALIQDLGDSYTRFLDRVRAEGGNLAALETASLGFDHAVLSARLLAHWGLPELLVRAVAIHPESDRLVGLLPEERMLPRVLHLAELVAQVVVDARPAALSELLEAGERYRALSLEQLRPILETLEEKVAQLADVLSLELPAGVAYLDLLAQAQSHLSVVAEDAAARLAREERVAESLLLDAQELQETLALAAQRGGSLRLPKSPTLGVSAMRAPHAPRGSGNFTGRSEDHYHSAPSGTVVLTAADPSLACRVAAGVAACRTARQSFSLAMLGLDRYDDMLLKLSVRGAAKVAGLAEAAIRAACDPADCVVPLGDGCFALFLERRDRPRAAELARDVMKGFARRVARHLLPSAATLSAGVATLALPPKNFSAPELIDAAERCLSAAQRSGGDQLKSIDL